MRDWMINRGVTFPESAAVPRRVSDSVGDVLGVRRRELTGLKESGALRPQRPY